MTKRYSNMTGAIARNLSLYNNRVSALFKHYYNSKIFDKWRCDINYLFVDLCFGSQQINDQDYGMPSIDSKIIGNGCSIDVLLYENNKSIIVGKLGSGKTSALTNIIVKMTDDVVSSYNHDYPDYLVLPINTKELKDYIYGPYITRHAIELLGKQTGVTFDVSALSELISVNRVIFVVDELQYCGDCYKQLEAIKRINKYVDALNSSNEGCSARVIYATDDMNMVDLVKNTSIFYPLPMTKNQIIEMSKKWHSNGFQNNLRSTFEHDLLVKQLNDYNFRRCISTPGVLQQMFLNRIKNPWEICKIDFCPTCLWKWEPGTDDKCSYCDDFDLYCKE